MRQHLYLCFLNCSPLTKFSPSSNNTGKILVLNILYIGEKIPEFSLNNQFDESYKITTATQKIIFVFQEETLSSVKSFLNTQKTNYLKNKNTLFVADISKVSTIMKWYVLDDLKEQKYNVFLINKDEISQNYLNEKSINKIMVVGLKDLKIIGIDYIIDIEELQNLIENN